MRFLVTLFIFISFLSYANAEKFNSNYLSLNQNNSQISSKSHSAVSVASRYINTNPTGQSRLWCAKFINYVEKKMGRKGTNSNLAFSFKSYGTKVSLSNIRKGDIVVNSRRGGGHVSYFIEWVERGKKMRTISGNTCRSKRGRTVCVSVRSVHNIVAVRRPH